MRSPILITGAARSGTSMTAGVIDLCGAFGGRTSGPTAYNKRGMYENSVIRSDLVKPYLRSIKCDPMGQFPLPDLGLLDVFTKMEKDGEQWRKDVEQVIKNHGYDHKKQWYYKGAKMCLMWPLWHSAFPEAKWVIVRRKPDDIVRSCMMTGFMRSYKTPDGWRVWIQKHENLFHEMSEQGLDVREVWPEKMVYNNYGEMGNVIKTLELEWNEENMKAAQSFITPSLWKGGNNGS